MCGTSFLNFSMRNVRIARMVRAELNVVRALRLRRGCPFGKDQALKFEFVPSPFGFVLQIFV